MSQVTTRQKERRQVRTVEVGDNTFNIGRISGYQFELAMDIFSRVMQEQERVQESLDEYVRAQQQKGAVRVYKTQKDDPAYAHYQLTDEMFGDNEYLDLQREVSPNAVFFHLFPLLWEVARDKLLAVLAVVAIDPSELRRIYEAEGDEGINDRLNDLSRELMFEGDIEDLMELAIVGGEAIKVRWDSKRERLGKVTGGITRAKQQEQVEESSTAQPTGKPKPGGLVSAPTQTESGQPQKSSKNGQKNLSTLSQESMAGAKAKPSSSSGDH